MKRMLSILIKCSVLSVVFLNLTSAQLAVGDTATDFNAEVCFNGEDVNPDFVSGDVWSLFDEGAQKVTWLNLFTSW